MNRYLACVLGLTVLAACSKTTGEHAGHQQSAGAADPHAGHTADSK